MSSTVEYYLKHRPTAEINTYPYPPANSTCSELLLPAIIVLNKRYYPNKHGSAATVGTEALSMSIAQAFKSMKVFCGIILYQRDETIDEPSITIQVINFNPCAILAFNFNMSSPGVEKAITLAASMLMENSGLEGTPMLYHQTDTLLEYHPRDLPFCVTHHAPFHRHFSGIFSEALAAHAYGDADKAEHLARKQEIGIKLLKHRGDGYVLQISRLQGKLLSSYGVNTAKIREICPSIQLSNPSYHVESEIAEMFNTGQITLFTAVARIDYFKNVDLLVDVAVALWSQNVAVRLFIAGGASMDSAELHELSNKVPRQFAQCATFRSKLSRTSLHALFRLAKDSGVFICPSRYETLGVTPLEAALSGVTTLIADSDHVEASRYFPESYRFRPVKDELCQMISNLQSRNLASLGEVLRCHVEAQVSDQRFQMDLYDAWAEFSLQSKPMHLDYSHGIWSWTAKMFRRRRSTSHHQQPLSTSNAQSAQSAASHAFLKSQPSSSSLSSAAAAAALRSLTPTPTPVENVQTKRMIQRRASIASQSSIPGSLRPSSQNTLRRANSSSSMSNRTFRDQSPRRPASSSGPVPIAPPIPSIPREYATRTPPNRRSVSVGPTLRPTSPVKRQPSGRGMSVDPAGRGSVSQPSARGHELDQIPELQRAGSRNSINFSYPMNSRPNSPALASEPLDRRDTSAYCQYFCAEEDKRGSLGQSRKKRPAGRHCGPCSTSSNRTRSEEAAYHPSPPRLAAPREQNTRDLASKAPTARETGNRPVHDQPDQHQSRDPAFSQQISETDHKQPPRPVLTKRPSTVPEDYPGEARAEADTPAEGVKHAPVNHSFPETRSTVRTPTPEKPKDILPSSIVSSPESTSSTGPERESQLLQARPPSSSPGRSTRFSDRLSVMGFVGEHLHQPPPRSVSPAKSAMKNPRTCSLSPDGRNGVVLRPGPALSELSDGTSAGSDEGSRLGFRRKPVKVSFDDEAEIVGAAASPPTSPEDIGFESPPVKPKGKTSWFGMGKRKSATVGSDEFDEVFKPRPELPSFGSIRKARDGELQEPVRQDMSDNESTTSSDPSVSPVSFSNDHAIGAIISNTQSRDANPNAQLDQTTSPTPGVAAKSGAPMSELGENSCVSKKGTQTKQDAPSVSLNSHQEAKLESSENLAVPGIAVQPATPEGERGRSSLDWYTVPGGFPRSSLEFDCTSHDSTRRKGKKQALGNPVTDATRGNISDEDESGESIYSDAEEGLEGDGFGSINAVVDEPTSTQCKDAVEVNMTTDNNTHSTDQVPPNLADIPQTCQIARVANPIHTISLSPVPESPSSSHERLPYSSPYPPFPTQSNSETNVQEAPRSSVATGTVRRSISVNAPGGRPARETTNSVVHGPLQPQSGNVSNQPRHRAGDEQIKKRPASWAPNLLKGGLDDDLYVNGNGPEPQRPLSNGSDSSSSFKRSNRPRTDSPHTIRRTLRGPSSSPFRTYSPQNTKLPPPNSRPLSSGSGTGSLRATLRSNDPRREKPAFFSTGKVQKARITKASGALFTSRFTESDDEQGTSQQKWQSRFEDSSDDEERVVDNLRPVRGIPRREGAHDGDSTELEDSSDNERPGLISRATKAKGSDVRAPRNPALAAVAKSRGMSEEEMEEFLRQPSGRKGSLFHRLSIRKPKAPSERGASRSRSEARNGSLDPEEVRDNLMLDGARGNTVTTITTNNIRPSSSPRRLRRGISRSSNGDSWPLRSNRKETDAGAPLSALRSSERPQTADGAFQNGNTVSNAVDASTKKADLAGTNATDAMDVEFASGRKKRFPRLRKAFGLRS
ncbi:hypothetical protein ABOM_010078 [Aspergillus bombycis]|uniref:Glycosyl transferase family 1 domain-containing protein n=1 Tax=Aspergillus bombycis TaxID=109264 RepID=A0A1F7ZQB9_9EURO|nr:hypothetical protein ABOM_010078 [Aspergillus bombycis]OGM41469.1 hypothetical protein ABOM_010078 [Aspergillus bombycis]